MTWENLAYVFSFRLFSLKRIVLQDIIDDGKTGFLVPTGDMNAFADRLRLLQEDRNLRRKLGVEARLETERWSWQSSMAKLRTEQYSAAQKNFLQRAEQRAWRFLTFNRSHNNPLDK